MRPRLEYVPPTIEKRAAFRCRYCAETFWLNHDHPDYRDTVQASLDASHQCPKGRK